MQDGGTSFIWKTDSASAQGPLECSGVGVLGRLTWQPSSRSVESVAMNGVHLRYSVLRCRLVSCKHTLQQRSRQTCFVLLIITGGLLACLSAMGTLAQIQSFLIDSKDSKDVRYFKIIYDSFACICAWL